jgi:fructose-1,6-bisphosphatase/inositol monophosphatase family enzyme
MSTCAYGPAAAGWHSVGVVDAAMTAEVERVIRAVARDQILPYFGRLEAGQIAEKSPGDLVTVADRAAEEALTEALTRMVPGSVVVGEEAVADDSTTLHRLTGDAPVWIIDPVDGTRNFADSSPRFSTLVTLAERGELLASWSYAPALNFMATAVRGCGSYVDGDRIRARPAPPTLRYLDVTTTMPRWWTPAQRAGMNALGHHGVSLSYFDTSGLEYVECASGRRTAMVLTWELVWDHAAGVLLVNEAGGVVCAADGAPFRVAGGNALPLIAAPDAGCAARLHTAYVSIVDTGCGAR